MGDPRTEAMGLLEALAPNGAPVPMRTLLSLDESTWFLKAVRARLIEFRECPADCFRFRKFGIAGPDHFDTPAGKPRHLFSKPGHEVAWLNREYVPHIAAYGMVILDGGYDPSHSSFSLYRKFRRDLISKRRGQSFETDAEFYDTAGAVYLQIEAKASSRQTQALAAAIAAYGSLDELPTAAAKEIEYVLDLEPRFLWVVGPESIQPAKHVFEVSVSSNNASFTPIGSLPDPPT